MRYEPLADAEQHARAQELRRKHGARLLELEKHLPEAERCHDLSLIAGAIVRGELAEPSIELEQPAPKAKKTSSK